MDNQISLIVNKFNDKIDSNAIEISEIKRSIPDDEKSLEIKISQIINTLKKYFTTLPIRFN